MVRVGEIPSEESAQRWLVEGLWGASSVGVIGGAPKCAKTWLGLDMALSRSHRHGVPGQVRRAGAGAGPGLSGRGCAAGGARAHRGNGPASRSRSRPSRGPRDHRACAAARSRSGSRAAAGRRPGGSGPGCCCWIPWCDFTASTRTTPAKWPSCWRTFASLQRQLDLSVLLVHHTRKNAAGGVAAGQGLRGSSDIHAFGDSNLYLRRSQGPPGALQRAPRGAGIAAGRIWSWSRPTRRRPTWRSSGTRGTVRPS